MSFARVDLALAVFICHSPIGKDWPIASGNLAV